MKPAPTIPTGSDYLNLSVAPEGETHRERMVRLAAWLMRLGVSNQKITQLLSFDLDRVEKQLRWLPFRSPRKHASLIVSAIEHDYEAPANLPTDEA